MSKVLNRSSSILLYPVIRANQKTFSMLCYQLQEAFSLVHLINMMAGKSEAIFGLFALCIFTVFDVSKAETIQGAISLNSGAFDKVSVKVL